MFKNNQFKNGSVRRIISIVTAILLIMALAAGCGNKSDSNKRTMETPDSGDNSGTSSSQDQTGSHSASETGEVRDYYCNTASAQSAVIMVYVIGSDLESDDGCATSDIQEMLYSTYGDDLKIVMQTGGASKWANNYMSSKTRQRWVIDDDGLTEVGDAGNGTMTDTTALSDFISWTAENYPADRYMLILWDHGGGTSGGYGSDEVYGGDSLSIADVAEAIGDSGVKFDVVGFDACLMATIETAYALEPYADYLIASEEYEPGYGWYYTDFITEFANDVSIGTASLAQNIIDDYDSYYKGTTAVTLSAIDLTKVPAVYSCLNDYLGNVTSSIQNDNSSYAEFSRALSNARSYYYGEIDQFDLIDFVSRTSYDGVEELVNAAEDCVVCQNSSTISGSNGVSIYVPHSDLSSYSSTRSVLQDIGFSDAVDAYDYIVSIMAGGQENYYEHGSDNNGYINNNQQSNNYEGENWYDQSTTNGFDYGNYYNDDLTFTETNEGFVLEEDQKFWDTIDEIQIAVIVDDGSGYIDLGTDNIYYWTEDGDLLMDFDYTWVSINGNIVPFYANTVYEDGDSLVYSGVVPALLNDTEYIDIYIEWEPQDGTVEDMDAYVLGYRPTENTGTTYAKGYKTFKEGDNIDFISDCYTYDGDYDGQYYIGSRITVTSQDDLEVTYDDIDSSFDVYCWYNLIDLYGNTLQTETISFS